MSSEVWKQTLFDDLRAQLSGSAWEQRLKDIQTSGNPRRLHLAVFVEPYLRYLVEGKKTVESRFSKNRCAPYGTIQPRDILVIKESGGPAIAVCEVAAVWFYNLAPESWDEIRRRFARQLCIDDSTFWSNKATALFATLMQVENVQRIDPIVVPKKDRRGWVVLEPGSPDVVSPPPPLQLTFHAMEVESRPSPINAKRGNALLAARCNSNCQAPVTLFSDISSAIEGLRSNSWRGRWWLTPLDDAASKKVVRRSESYWSRAVEKRLESSIGRVYSFRNGSTGVFRDGTQTPFTGNIIFYAQHALALCCRRCVEDWYGIPKGRALTHEEVEWFKALILVFIRERSFHSQ